MLRRRPFRARPGWNSRLVSAISTLLLAILVSSPSWTALAQETAERTTLTGSYQKQQFVAGERVEISKATVADDVFAAGQDLTFESVSAKNIFAAGMSLSFKSIEADDLILAGGQMTLSGIVKDDVVAAVCPFCPFGGRLHLTDGMQIGDDARLAGRDIAIDGKIGGDLYAAAQYVKLSGEVVGNAKIEATTIVLAPGARIGGDLTYVGPNKPEVPEGATVAGKIRKVKSDLPIAEGFPTSWIWYGVLAIMGFLVALILLGGALQLVVPGLLSAAATTAVDRPWASLGRGLVIALLTPAVTAVVMATVIGVPIGIVTIATFVVLLAMAFVAICYCIGLFVRGLFARTDVPAGYSSRLLWTAAGILILVVIGLVPFIGWALGVLAILAGLGAVIGQLGPFFGKAAPEPAAA